MEPQVHLAPIAVAPVLPSEAALASFGLAIDRVRFIVVRPSAAPDTLADTTVALPPDSATLDLDLRVPLIAAAETLEVSVIVLSGTIPLFQGTASVVVTSEGAPATPTEIPVQTYVGPGAGVDSIVISPAAPFLFFNDSLRFQVAAFQGGVPVSQFYVSWSTSDTTVARINGVGLLRAPATRTSVRVIARTAGGGAVDSTPARFVPLPTQLIVVAGDGQTGTIGLPLATQLEVEVRAADNLPVGGVAVRFRSLSGGAPVDTTVTSDAAGRARVTGVLGPAVGAQSFQATLPAFPAVAPAAFSVTAISATTIFWANAAGGNWSNPANWSGGLVPTAIDTAAITLPGSYTVTLDVSDTVGGLELGAPTGTQTLVAASKTLRVSGTSQINANGVLDFRASTLEGGTLSNGGTVLATGSATIGPTVVTTAGSLIRVQGNGVLGAANLTLSSSSTNNGTIGLTDTTSTYGATLSMPAGATLTNGPGGTIDAAVGSGGQRTLALALNNQGTLTLNHGLTLNRASAVHTNSGTINVVGGDFTLTQSGTGPTFTMAGTGAITIAPARTFAVSGGAFNYDAGTISGGGTFSISSASVTAAQSFSTATAALSMTSSTWGGSGTLTVASGTSVLVRASTIDAPLVNQGTLIASGSSAFNGPFTTASGTTLRVQGNGTYGLGTLTIAGGFTNNGAIELTDTTAAHGATLNVSAGTLLNAAGGTIAALLGFDGQRTLGAQLDNQGSITVATAPNQAFTISKASANHQNSGTIAISGGDLAVTQSGTTPSFTNTGTITVAAGDSLRVSGGAFTHNGGTLGGAGALSLNSVTAGAFNVVHSIASMRVTSSTVSFATDQSTGATGFVFIGSTINGPGLLTNAAGRVLNVQASTINTGLDNQGTLLVNGSSPFNGALTTAAGSQIRVQGNGSYGLATMRVATGFMNNGAIELTDTTSASGATLNVSAGTLLNAPGATISALLGFSGPRTLGAQLDNQGSITVATVPDQALTINKASADHQNSGTIAINSGDLVLNQSDTTPSFTNTGTITVAAGDSLRVTGGAFTHDSGTLGGAGVLSLNSVTAAFNVAHSIASMPIASSTVSFATAQTTDSTAFVFKGSTINGPGTLTNSVLKTISLDASHIGAPFINEGTLIAAGASSLDGPVTTLGGSLLRVLGQGPEGTLTVTNGFVNNGTIQLTDTVAAYGATLVVKGVPPFVNAGTIDILPGFGGPRTIDAVLDNQGAFTVNQSVSVSHDNAAHTNRGTFKVRAGGITFAQSGGNPSFTNQVGGVIDIDAGTVFRVTAGSVTNSSLGKILGFGTLDVHPPVTFSSDGDIIPGTSPGKLTVAGNIQITATGILTIELGGPKPGTEYDQLEITDAANFAEGTLNVSLLPTLPDPKGMFFDVMPFGPGTSPTALFRIFNAPPGCSQQNTGTSIRVIC